MLEWSNGRCWESALDHLIIEINDPPTSGITKRIFDLLGLMDPVVLSAKLLIQIFWQLRLREMNQCLKLFIINFKEYPS